MLSILRIGLNKSSVNNAQRSWLPYGGDEEKSCGAEFRCARINERMLLVLRARPCAGIHRVPPRDLRQPPRCGTLPPRAGPLRSRTAGTTFRDPGDRFHASGRLLPEPEYAVHTPRGQTV